MKRFTIENPRPRRLGRSFHSALLLGALALSAATGCTQCDDESKAHSDSEAARPSAGTTTPRPVPPIVAFEKPTRFRFRLESSSTLPGQSGEAQMTITGSLWLSGHPAEDSLSVHAVLETPETLVNGKTQPEFQEMVVKMNEGAIFSFKAGVLTTLSVPSSVEPQVANLWRTIGATLQHSGQGKREGSWSAREHDSTGEYEASYRWDEDNLVRTKTKYVSLLQSGMETATLEQLEPRIKESRTTIQLATQRLASISLDETIDADLQKGVTMTVKNRIVLARESERPPSPELLQALGGLLAPESHAQFPAERPISLRTAGVDQSQFDHLRIENWTFEEAAAQAANVEELAGEDQEAKTEERRRVYSAYSALTAYLRSHPETLPKAKKAISTSDASARVIVSALGDAGTEEAQELLIEVIGNESLPGELRSRAIVRLARTDVPIPAAVDALEAQLGSERLWGQAVLALGIAGRHYRDAGRQEDFIRASHVIEGQLDKYGTEGNPRLSKVLSAVSNLGDRRLLPRVRPLLESKDEDTRASAAFSMRHMDDNSVDPLLARALAENGSTKSRLTVLSAMRVRGPQPILRRALTELLAHAETQGQVLTRAKRLQDSWEGVTP